MCASVARRGAAWGVVLSLLVGGESWAQLAAAPRALEVGALRDDPRGGGRLVEVGGLELAPPAPDQSFGHRAAPIGDLTGDGVAEIAVAAPGYAAGTTRVGRVFVYDGATGALLAEHRGGVGEQFGLRVGNAGDCDGDGAPDLRAAAVAWEDGLLVERLHLICGATGRSLMVQELRTIAPPGSPVILGGDLDRDGDVDVADVHIVAKSMGARGGIADVDEDGAVTSRDLDAVMSEVGRVGEAARDPGADSTGGALRGWANDPFFFCWDNPHQPGGDCDIFYPPSIPPEHIGIPGEEEGPHTIWCAAGVAPDRALMNTAGELRAGATLVHGGTFSWAITDGASLLTSGSANAHRYNFVTGTTPGEVDFRMTFSAGGCAITPIVVPHTLRIDDMFLDLAGCRPTLPFDEWMRIETDVFPEGGTLYWKQLSGPALVHWDENAQRLEIISGYEAGTVRLVAHYALNGVSRFQVCEFDIIGLPNRDFDEDGLSDADEVTHGTDPTDPDTDDDGLEDGCEVQFGTDPLQAGSPDVDTAPWNADVDHDGLPDIHELCLYGLNPAHFDTDGDGLSDGFEVEHGLDPQDTDSDDNGVSDFYDDLDGDDVSNGDEESYGTDPHNADSDGDGTSDGDELANRGIPTDASDGGQPIPEGEAVVVHLTIGDPNPIPTESWALHVGDRRFIAPQGNPPTRFVLFRRGESLPVSLTHLGSTQHPPRASWLLKVYPLNNLGYVDDPEHLLGVHWADDECQCQDCACDAAEGREATLHLSRFDLDIDSNNDNGFDSPSLTNAEDEIEDDPTVPGKLIPLATADRDGDGIPGFADGFGIDPMTGNDDSAHGYRFVPIRLRIQNVDLRNETIRFTYMGSAPEDVTIDDGPYGRVYAAAPGELRIWTKDAFVPRNPASVADGGDYVEPGVALTPQQIGLSSYGGDIVLYVEALKPSEFLGDLTIDVSAAGHGDRVRLTGYGLQMTGVGTNGAVLGPTTPVVSHPTPTITMGQFVLENVRTSPDSTRLIGDLVISGAVDDAFSDLRPGEAGIIDHVRILTGGEPATLLDDDTVLEIPVVYSKGSGGSLLKPFDYAGQFSATITGIEVQPGWNTFTVEAQNSRGLIGFAQRSFEVQATSPPDVMVALVIENPKGNELTATIATIDPASGHQTIVTGLFTHCAACPLGVYENGPMQIAVDPAADFDLSEGFRATVLWPDQSLVGVDLWVERSSPRSIIFSGWRLLEEQERLDWTGYTFIVTPATAITASTGGTLHPLMIQVLGPSDLGDAIDVIEFTSPFTNAAGQQMVYEREYAVTEYEGRFLLALPGNAHPEVMLALLPMTFDQVVADAISELRYGFDSFALGFGQGMLDTGADIVDSIGSTIKLGYHLAVHYNTVSVLIRLSHGESVLLAEDRAALSAIWEQIPALVNLIWTIMQLEYHAVIAGITGDTSGLEQFGAEHREGIIFFVELLLAIRDELQAMDDYEKGRIVGRIFGELAVEIVLATTTGGSGNVARKSTQVVACINKVSNLNSIPTGVKQKLLDLLAYFHLMRNSRSCFAAGTLVLASHGLVPIESIQAGDLVISRSEETGEIAMRPVLEVFETNPSELVELTILPSGGDELDTERIVGTGEHPFYIAGRDAFVPMRELRIGDALVLNDGVSTAYVTDIQVQRGPPAGADRFTTYNFEVGEWHTYFVGRTGVWVHNAGKPCENWFSVDDALRRLAPNGTAADDINKRLLETKDLPRRDAVDMELANGLEDLQRNQYRTATSHSDVASVQQLYDIQHNPDHAARLAAATMEVHHTIPKYCLPRMIQLAKPHLSLEAATAIARQVEDSMPGFLVHQKAHRGARAEGLPSLHSIMRVHIPNGTADSVNSLEFFRMAIRQSYQEWGRPELAPIGESWFDALIQTIP